VRESRRRENTIGYKKNHGQEKKPRSLEICQRGNSMKETRAGSEDGGETSSIQKKDSYLEENGATSTSEKALKKSQRKRRPHRGKR